MNNRFVNDSPNGISAKIKSGTKELIKQATPISDIVKKHGMTYKEARDLVAHGAKHEMEHTDNELIAHAISSHHVYEYKDYYDRLEKAFKE